MCRDDDERNEADCDVYLGRQSHVTSKTLGMTRRGGGGEKGVLTHCGRRNMKWSVNNKCGGVLLL